MHLSLKEFKNPFFERLLLFIIKAVIIYKIGVGRFFKVST